MTEQEKVQLLQESLKHFGIEISDEKCSTWYEQRKTSPIRCAFHTFISLKLKENA